MSIDARRQQLIGVRTARAERRRSAVDVRAPGTVAFDETKETEINSKVDGWVRDLKANYTGMPVRKGDPLFTLYSPELLATENEFIVALRGREQAQQSTLPETRDHAERLIQAVRERLMFWDVSVAEIREMERRGTRARRHHVRLACLRGHRRESGRGGDADHGGAAALPARRPLDRSGWRPTCTSATSHRSAWARPPR